MGRTSLRKPWVVGSPGGTFPQTGDIHERTLGDDSVRRISIRRQPFGVAGLSGRDRKHNGRRGLDPLVYHRSLRVEPMEERTLLSVGVQFDHVIYDPAPAKGRI